MPILKIAAHKVMGGVYVTGLLLVMIGFAGIQASDTHGTRLQLVVPSQWLLLNSPLDSAKIRSVSIRRDRLIVLVTNRSESELVELTTSGEIVSRRQMDGSYDEVAGNSLGGWALLRIRSAPAKSLILPFNPDDTPMEPIESSADSIIYFGQDLFGRNGEKFVSVRDTSKAYEISLGQDAEVRALEMADGSPILLDLMTARFSRPGLGEQSKLIFLSAPETKAIVDSRGTNEASIVAASALRGASVLALVSRFRTQEGVVAIQFDTRGQTLNGYRFLLPTVSAGSPTIREISGNMLPALMASAGDFVFLANRKPPAVAVYHLSQ